MSIRNHLSSSRGAVLVEASLILPLVLLLVFGILDGARYIAAQNEIKTISHEAARYGSSVGVAGSGKQRFVDCDGIRTAGMAISNLELADLTVFEVDYDNGPMTSPNGKCEAGQSASRTVKEGDRVVITVSDDWTAVTPFLSSLMGTRTITSVAHRTILSPG
jgi:Flp pilus assembly protein TadG